MPSAAKDRAYIVTGPTSGIGYRTALELAAHGTVILVGRNPAKLAEVKATIEGRGGSARSVVCDMADLAAIRRAAGEILALPLTVAGVLNNAGIRQSTPTRTAAGWDATFATNYLGPIAFIEALAPHLPDGTNMVSVGSAIEDPERAPAKAVGMRGGQFISVAASADGQWKAGGSRMPGIDAYATSKQCMLAATLALARDNPRLRFNVVEPGINPGTGLEGRHNPVAGFIVSQIVMRLPPFGQFRSTPDKAAKVIARVLTLQPGETGVYYGEKGQPMRGSTLAHDLAFQDRVLAETRAFLAANAPPA